MCDLVHKTHNAPVAYPTMQYAHVLAYFCYKMVQYGVLSDASWNLWDVADHWFKTFENVYFIL